MPSVFKKKKPSGEFYSQWRFRYVDANGRRVEGIGWRDFKKTRDHAMDVESEARALRTGQKVAPPAWQQNRNKAISEVVEAYLEWGRAGGGRGGRPWNKQNAQAKERDLDWWIQELGLKTLADIDLVRVEKALRDLVTTGLAPKSIALRLEALRCLCNWSIKRAFLNENPLRGMAAVDARATDPHRALTEAEAVNLLRVAPAHRRVWYETALETGYRVGELRALRVQDLDRAGRSLPLGADYTKNRKDARQPITSELAAKLEQLARGKSPAQSLLGIPVGRAWEQIKIDYTAAGIEDTSEGRVTWHSLRKVYVNNLIRSGADVKVVMELARHSAASMTLDVYASAKPAMLREATENAVAHLRSAGNAAGRGAGVATTKGKSVNIERQSDYKIPATGFEPVTNGL